MSLILVLALIITIAWGVEAFSNDGVAVRVAKIAKFGCGVAFCVLTLL